MIDTYFESLRGLISSSLHYKKKLKSTREARRGKLPNQIGRLQQIISDNHTFHHRALSTGTSLIRIQIIVQRSSKNGCSQVSQKNDI